MIRRNLSPVVALCLLLSIGSIVSAQTYPQRAIKIHAPTDVLWPSHDPLFPPQWADRLEHYFTDVLLHMADGTGHFTPLECPEQFARLVLSRARSSRVGG